MGPPDELAEYYARKYPLAFREDPRLSKEALAERRERGWWVAKQAADILRRSFGIRKVVAFGSLIDGARFTP